VEKCDFGLSVKVFFILTASTELPHGSHRVVYEKQLAQVSSTLSAGSVEVCQTVAPLTAVVMSRTISENSGSSFFIFSTRLMELSTVEWWRPPNS